MHFSHDNRPSDRHQLLPRHVCVAEHDGDDVKQRAKGDDDAADKILRKYRGCENPARETIILRCR